MPITSVKSDPEKFTLTVEGEYPVPVQKLWDAYADARKIERFWGPVEWPATFTQHDMQVGGRSTYFMTGPDGTKSSGWWKFLAVQAGRGFEVEDGFAKEDGTPNTDMPSMRMVFEFHATATGSQLRCTTYFPSLQAMEELVKMGMLEGMRSAMGQLDAVLAAG